MKKQFLIIQTAFIGDVILSTAIIEKLAIFFSNAQIDYLLRKGNENILDNNPHINRVFVWDKNHGKYRSLFRLIKEIRKTRYHVVINLQRFASSGFLTCRSKSDSKVGYLQNPFSFCYTNKIPFFIDNGEHEIERNQHLIAHLTDNIPSKPRIYPSKSDMENLPDIKKSFITISPASVWFTKQFPKEQWIIFLNKYLLADKTVYLLGSEQDYNLCETIKNNIVGKTVINLAGKLTLLQSAALMKQADMNYVNDSAPLHLASAVDAPVTAIFCSTVPTFGFGPLSTISKVVEIKKQLPCRPCGIHGKKQCPEKHFKCAMEIDLNDLTVF